MQYKPRYNTLDHWRGLAALMVIFHHTPLYSYEMGMSPAWGDWLISVYKIGWWGVPMFFAISGYCVLGAADRTPDGITYFKRRLRRIYPPYFAAILLAIVAWPMLGSLLASDPYPIPSPTSLTVPQWVGNLTLTGTWSYRFLGSVPFFLGPAWTLCYEEGYYLIVGLLFVGLGRRWVFWGLSGLTLVCVALRNMVDFSGTPGDFYLLAFTAGAAAFWCLTKTAKPTIIATAIALLLAAGVLCAKMDAELFALHSSPRAGCVIGMAFAALLIALRPFDEQAIKVRWLVPLEWCGMRCYSVYLVHWPICKAIATAFHQLHLDNWMVLWPLATLSCSLFVGHWFHVLIERRFMTAYNPAKVGVTGITPEVGSM